MRGPLNAKFRIRNIYCFPTPTMLARRQLIVCTVHCLVVFYLKMVLLTPSNTASTKRQEYWQIITLNRQRRSTVWSNRGAVPAFAF